MTSITPGIIQNKLLPSWPSSFCVNSEDGADKGGASPRGLNDRPLLQHKDSQVADRTPK